jgi:hypothetical protein
MIYLTAIGLTPGGSSTHLYTKQIYRTTQSNNTSNSTFSSQTIHGEECGPCPVFARYILAFALQLRKKHGKTSVRVPDENRIYRIEYA